MKVFQVALVNWMQYVDYLHTPTKGLQYFKQYLKNNKKLPTAKRNRMSHVI